MGTDKSKKGKPRNNNRHDEQELEEWRAKFKAIFEHACSGVAIYEAYEDGEDFVFVDFNPAAEQIEHIAKDELIGRKVTEVFPGVKQFGLLDVLRRVYKTGTPEHHPVSVYKDQRIAGWRENYVCRLPSGHVVAVYDDISARKRTELVAKMTDQCFRAIADYTYDWEVWVGPTGRVLWTNPAAQRVTGYSVREIMALPEYPGPLVHEDDRARMEKAFESARRGSTGNDVEFRLLCKNGSVVWVEMSWQPIYNDDGESLGNRQSIRDISARKQAEQALQDARVKGNK